MNLGRGFPVPQEKQIIQQNDNFWFPATPDKPVVQRSNYPQQPETHQQSQTGQENWQDLLGIYTGLLQDEPDSRPPKKLNLNTHVIPNYRKNNIQDAAPVMTHSTLSQNFIANGLVEQNHREPRIHNGAILPNFHQNGINSSNFHQNWANLSNFHKNGVISPNFREQNIQSVASVENFRRLNQNGGSMAPQKVNSLEELLGSMNGSQHAPLTNGKSSRSTYITEKQTNFRPPSQAERSHSTNYKSSATLLQQNHISQVSHTIGDYNQPQTTNVRPSVPSRPGYNLNFPPRSEVGESSSALKLLDQLWPATPDQHKHPKTHQIIKEPVLRVNEIPNQEKDTQGNCVFSQQSKIIDKNSNDFMQSASSVEISTPSNEKNGGNEVGIDLNKTPPQKTPKRKKHRPKVVKEVKQKKTPKPKINTPDEKPTEKRKYVRRKGIETPKAPSTDVAHDTAEVDKIEPAAKSCRRSLNFDMEKNIEKEIRIKDFDYQGQGNEGNKVPIDLNLASNNTKCSEEINEPSNLAPKEGHQDIVNKDNEQIPCEKSVQLTAQPPAPKNHTLNAIARSLSFRNVTIKQSGGENRYDPTHHHLGGGLAQFVIQANNKESNLDGRTQPLLHSKPQLLESSVKVAEKQRSQRDNSRAELAQPRSVTLMGSTVSSNGISKKGDYIGHSSTSWQKISESIKKIRAEEKIHGTSSGVISEITMKSRTQSSQSGSPNSDSKGKCTSADLVAYFNSADFEYKFQQQNTSSQVHQRAERLGQNTSHFPSNMQSAISVPTVSNCNQESAKFSRGNEMLNSFISVPVKRQTEQTPLRGITIVDRMHQKETKNSHAKKIEGSRGKKKILFSVDDISYLLKGLTLNNTGKEISQGEQNALVPYRGDGGIVPYEAFDPIKRRVPRPKVDLDPETNRLWNLLMGKVGSESSEKVDIDKQKWWEEERKVFRGRVDSFIARMHLVQGDRRFSKWKGSVVDSVIGVFLTQNVSDHLSSSAFMSLAAKFPLKSRTNKPECSKNGKSQSDKRHQVRVTYPDDSAEFRAENAMNETRNHLVNDNFRTEEDIISSQSSSESVVYQSSEDIRSSSGSNSETEEQLMWRNFNLNHGPVNHAEQAKRTAALHQHQFQIMGMVKRPLIDQQPSEKPLYGQYLGVVSGRNANFHPFTQNGPSPVIQSTRPWLSMLMGPEKECTSSLTSVDFGYTTGNQCGETSYMPQVEKPKTQASLAHHRIVNKYIGQQTNSQAAFQGINAQHFINFRQESFQKEGTFVGPTRPVEALSKQPSGNLHKYPGLYFNNQANVFAHNSEKSESVTPKQNETGQVHSSEGPSNTIGNAIPNGRKRKAEKEKVEPFNWDVLREQVKSKNGTCRGINVNAMDSLDYEALINADVRVISDAIKERGMNNMLAERMKDFLNRMVRDHGRVDLEWLRDVQPDKAKDYLLSIRGLGLKSVECVRLLTLHHLAFPVDTNVGRIAVRLGWVPLQPLPESLQLHLLEMYPVLESIQKYLWPRLCKLDQETLYELHYQMITFGKVFCTKRDPNCNACPMRGECRHFASAFASARLALPGPEEKRIVTSAEPITAKKGFDVNIRPVPLLQAGYNFEGERETGLCNPRSYEPIIEEPSTPEAPIEVLERDIEDAFYEDPDEIPVIKLNLEEFTTNLQSFMQENMEMQEVDMSRALVSLSPELASIPTPKLKHVSRLRTEHQVYELPDSHPLLKGMDRREPDDPSPYLLAIWTPGETADSVQPPESKCSSQEGGPCNLSTCFSCNSTREAHAQTVRGTILIPCRTAMRGSFPLNGTYFQVNELFADHESSLNPIDVPRSLLWNLPKKTVFFGTSVSSIFKGLSTQDIQFCFWKGFVCVRGFDRENRAPRPLRARLHFTARKMMKQNEQRKTNDSKQV